MTITIRNYAPHPFASPGQPGLATQVNRVFIARQDDGSGAGPWKMWAGNILTGQLSVGDKSFTTFAEAIAYAPRFYAEENAS